MLAVGEVLEPCLPGLRRPTKIAALTRVLIAKDEHRKVVSSRQHDFASIYNKDAGQARNALRWLPLSFNPNQLFAIEEADQKPK